MKASTIRQVVLLGIISIVGIIGVQLYWLSRAYNAEEAQFQRSVFIALQTTSERLAVATNVETPNETSVQKVSSNYYVVNVNTQIDASLLEYYLKTELKKAGLNLDFEYAIYDCRSDKMVYGNYISVKKTEDEKGKPRALPKYNKYTYYFGIYFPTKNSFVAGRITIWLVTTIVMLVVTSFFGYAIYVILQQRRFGELQQDFVNNIVHELKTPLSTITLAASTLTKADATFPQPKRLQYLKIIADEASRLDVMAQRVLQSTRARSNAKSLKLEDILLVDFMANITDTATITWPFARITCDIIDPKLTITADLAHLNNMVLNLLENAVKYADKDDVKGVVTINLNASKNGNKVQIDVKDNGVGISPKHQKRIFKRFYRIPQGNLHNVKGYGIGLFYVKQMMEAHRGDVSLKSQIGVGSTFSLVFRG